MREMTIFLIFLRHCILSFVMYYIHEKLKMFAQSLDCLPNLSLSDISLRVATLVMLELNSRILKL